MEYTVLGLSVLASAFLGFLAGYMKKKGENFATHEDIGKLVDQVSAVTKATKDIEAKITSDMWGRQKRWELKREVLFEATKKLADIEEGLLAIDSVLQVERKGGVVNSSDWAETKFKETKKWGDASSAFDESRQLVAMVCDKETAKAFDSFGMLVNQIAPRISAESDGEIYRKSFQEREKLLAAIRALVRKELGI